MKNMAPDVKALLEKWGPLVDPSDDPRMKDEKLREQTAIILENQQEWIDEVSYSSPDVARFTPILIPLARRTFPETVAHELVGVQPMSGPVGIAFALRFVAQDTYSSCAASAYPELGHNLIDPGYSGASGVTSGQGLVTSAGERLGDSESTGSGDANDVGLRVVSQTITARTRKLKTQWSLEAEQDLRNMHGVSIDNDMVNILSYEITQEIDRELLGRMRAAVNQTVAFTVASADGRWENERWRVFYNMLVMKANRIAYLTRRGSANFIVASPDVCALLETQNNFTLAPLASNVDTGPVGVAKVGALDGRFTVYRDTFTTSAYSLLGYKGPSIFDSGIIYCPYIPLLVSRTIREDSFHPQLGMMTRYGITTNLLGASNYYIAVNPTLDSRWYSVS
jgi:hypothetical protein